MWMTETTPKLTNDIFENLRLTGHIIFIGSQTLFLIRNADI